jgi:hypothetical protein
LEEKMKIDKDAADESKRSEPVLEMNDDSLFEYLAERFRRVIEKATDRQSAEFESDNWRECVIAGAIRGYKVALRDVELILSGRV